MVKRDVWVISSAGPIAPNLNGAAFNISGNGTVGGNLTVGGTLNANLPSGSGNYIQNTTSQQAGSNFNISGNGTVGGTVSSTNLFLSSPNNVVATGSSSSTIGTWLQLNN